MLPKSDNPRINSFSIRWLAFESGFWRWPSTSVACNEFFWLRHAFPLHCRTCQHMSHESHSSHNWKCKSFSAFYISINSDTAKLCSALSQFTRLWSYPPLSPVGHNLGGMHPFHDEEFVKKGETGGIMDYSEYSAPECSAPHFASKPKPNLPTRT